MRNRLVARRNAQSAIRIVRLRPCTPPGGAHGHAPHPILIRGAVWQETAASRASSSAWRTRCSSGRRSAPRGTRGAARSHHATVLCRMPHATWHAGCSTPGGTHSARAFQSSFVSHANANRDPVPPSSAAALCARWRRRHAHLLILAREPSCRRAERCPMRQRDGQGRASDVCVCVVARRTLPWLEADEDGRLHPRHLSDKPGLIWPVFW
jgi:hypothetical protein